YKVVSAVSGAYLHDIVLVTEPLNVLFQNYFHCDSVNVRLLQGIACIGQQREVACALDGLSHLLLKLQTCTGESAGQDLALLVNKLQQEVRILIVNVLDSILLEAAVLGFYLCTLDRFVHQCHRAGSSSALRVDFLASLFLLNSPLRRRSL